MLNAVTTSDMHTLVELEDLELEVLVMGNKSIEISDKQVKIQL